MVLSLLFWWTWVFLYAQWEKLGNLYCPSFRPISNAGRVSKTRPRTILMFWCIKNCFPIQPLIWGAFDYGWVRVQGVTSQKMKYWLIADRIWCSHPTSAAAADVGREAVERAAADQEEDEGDEEEKEELCEEEPAWPWDHLRIPHRRWPPLQLQQWGVHRPQVRSNLKTLISKYSLLSRSDRGKRLSLDSGVSLGCPGLSLAWEVKNTIWDEISTALKTTYTVNCYTVNCYSVNTLDWNGLSLAWEESKPLEINTLRFILFEKFYVNVTTLSS